MWQSVHGPDNFPKDLSDLKDYINKGLKGLKGYQDEKPNSIHSIDATNKKLISKYEGKTWTYPEH